MAQKKTTATADKLQQKQKRLLDSYRQKETWMKWAIIIALILILLLLLLLGFATDWTRGLRKDSTTATTPIDSSLDSLRTNNGNATPANTTGDASSTDTSTTTGGTDRTATSSDHSSSTTTTNSTSTTTNNTTPGTPSKGLLQQLYDDSAAGDNINNITTRAAELGLAPDCHTELVFQVCDFGDENGKVTVKSLLGSGLVTGVTKNFQ